MADHEINWQAQYLEQIHARLGGLDRGQHSLEQGQRQLEARMSSLEQGQKALEEGQRQLVARMGALEQEQRQLAARMGGLEEGQRQLEARIDLVRDELRDDIREVRKIAWGTLATVVAAVIGAAIRSFV